MLAFVLACHRRSGSLGLVRFLSSYQRLSAAAARRSAAAPAAHLVRGLGTQLAVSGMTSAPRLFSFVDSVAAPTRVSARGFASPAAAQGNVGDVIAFPLADIGEGIAECEILQWFITEGQTIKQFDKVCEVSSDKANVEITSRYDGVVQQIMHKKGEMAAVGKPLFTIKLTTATAKAAASGASATAPAAAAAAAPKASGAACPGVPVTSAAVLAAPRSNSDVLASPVVRRMASELGIELGRVAPTGIKGQITKEDLLQYQAAIGAGLGGASAAASAPVAATAQAFHGTVTVAAAPAGKPAPEKAAPSPLPVRGGAQVPADKEVPVTGIQKVMAKTMTAAAAIPTFGFADEICVDKLIALRKHILPFATKHGLKPSYFAFVLKAMSLALSKYPSVNSHVNGDCSMVTVKGAHNIGVAMDTPRGLLVPNIKGVQNLSVLEIAAELSRLQALGKEGKLGQADLAGGTITLSNIGVIGGTYCRPVLVVPEVMIGALGKFTTVAAFDAKGVAHPSTVMHLSWTADHRVLDGATVARFSNEMKELIENPEALVLY